MTDTTLQSFITEADLLHQGANDAFFEVLHGEPIPMSPIGLLHALIVNNIYDALAPFVKAHKLGIVFGDGLIYRMEGTPDNVRISFVPDASFIRQGRIPKDFDIRRPFPGAPDLAVEVMLPSDDASVLIAKVREYLRLGTEQVLVIYPEAREVHQYKQGESVVYTYREDAPIDLAAFFPKLNVITRALFALPTLE